MAEIMTPPSYRTLEMSHGLSLPAAIVLFAVAMSAGGCQFHTSSGPCRGWHTDVKACLDAAANSQVIGQVKLGQTTEEVRVIMGKDPERRDASEVMESWSYLTDYEHELLTTIVFKNNVVIEIKQTPWGL